MTEEEEIKRIWAKIEALVHDAITHRLAAFHKHDEPAQPPEAPHDEAVHADVGHDEAEKTKD